MDSANVNTSISCPFEGSGSYIAQQIMHSVICIRWLLIGGLKIWYSEEGPGQAAAPPSPLLPVPNVSPSINSQCIDHRTYCSAVFVCPLKG